MKKKPDQSINTKVQVIRPEVVVIVTIGGESYKLTDAAARELHGQLTKQLGIPPDIVYRESPKTRPPWERPFIPSPTPQWIQPPVPYLIDKIMC